MTIKILPSEVVDRIAAGEVVRRPASAVKELVENSIDSGAGRIDVYFEAGGKTLRVSDNGTGMDGEELKLAVKRHATSKIEDSKDLESIKTMGFRGEALPSMASVSKLEITTKKDSSRALKLKMPGGDRARIQPAARGTGTTVEVKDLFYNTPARRKFLKTEATEKKHIVKVVEALSLARPDIYFTLKEKDRIIFDFPPSDLKQRFCQIGGKNLAGKLLKVNFENPYIKLLGWAGGGEVYFSNKNRIYIFVNNRPVRSPVVLHSLARAYRQFIPPKKYPACVLNIKVKPALVDVNVHPAKREVKFVNQQGVHQIVSKVLGKELEKSSGIFDSESYREKTERESPPSKKTYSSRPSGRGEDKEQSMDYLKDIDLSRVRKFRFSSPSLDDSRRKPSGGAEIRPAFQFKNKYIVAEDSEGILLIDQHTAWERINYEALIEESKKEKPASQGLLIPEVIEVERSRAHLIQSNTGIFKNYGLIIEEFGPSSFKITAVPASVGKALSGREAAEMVEEITDILEKRGKTPSREELRDEILKLIACRSSVMAGDPLSDEEVEKMAERLNRCKIPHRCPHGRPIIIRFTEKEIDRKFSR